MLGQVQEQAQGKKIEQGWIVAAVVEFDGGGPS